LPSLPPRPAARALQINATGLSVGGQSPGFEQAVLLRRDRSHDPNSCSLFDFLSGRLHETYRADPFKANHPPFRPLRRCGLLKLA